MIKKLLNEIVELSHALKINYTNLNTFMQEYKNIESLKRRVIFFFDLSCFYRFVYGKLIKTGEYEDEFTSIEDNIFTDKYKLKLSPAYAAAILNIVAHYRHYFCTKYKSSNIFYLYTSREENHTEFFDKVYKILENFISYIPGVFITNNKNSLYNFMKNIVFTLNQDKKILRNICFSITKDPIMNAMLYDTLIGNLNVIQYEKGEISIKKYPDLYPEFEELFNKPIYNSSNFSMLDIVLCKKYDKSFNKKRKNTQYQTIIQNIEKGIDLIESMNLESQALINNMKNSIKNNGIREKIVYDSLKNWHNKMFDKNIFHVNNNLPDPSYEIKIDVLLNDTIH